jgi:hypothetical protein
VRAGGLGGWLVVAVDVGGEELVGEVADGCSELVPGGDGVGEVDAAPEPALAAVGFPLGPGLPGAEDGVGVGCGAGFDGGGTLGDRDGLAELVGAGEPAACLGVG